jgi:hypothetical protein
MSKRSFVLLTVAVLCSGWVVSCAPSKSRQMKLEEAAVVARRHVEKTRPNEQRDLSAVTYIPSHASQDPRGYWLVDLTPYPPDEPLPANPVTSLLITMDGKVTERGGRRPVSVEENEKLEEQTRKFEKLLKERETATPAKPAS